MRIPCLARIVIAAAIMLLTAIAMSASIKWESTVYDFGTFHEEKGVVTGELCFINEGPDTTFVSRVRPSCGCTSAGFTPDPIPPGGRGCISVSYDAKGRPGHFDKIVRVYTGKENTITSVRLQGVVIGTAASLASRYPVEAGPLRFTSKSLATGEVRYGSSRYLYLTAYNTSDEAVWPEITGLPAAISVMATSPSIAPGETASYSVYYDSRQETDMGEKVYTFDIIPTAGAEPLTVSIAVNVVPDTSKMTVEEVKNAPRIALPTDVITVERPKKEKPVAIDVTIINEGKSDLHLSRIYSDCSSLAIKSIPMKIKGGAKGKATMSLDMKTLPVGPKRIEVKICSDDPIHPITPLYIVMEN